MLPGPVFPQRGDNSGQGSPAETPHPGFPCRLSPGCSSCTPLSGCRECSTVTSGVCGPGLPWVVYRVVYPARCTPPYYTTPGTAPPPTTPPRVQHHLLLPCPVYYWCTLPRVLLLLLGSLTEYSSCSWEAWLSPVSLLVNVAEPGISPLSSLLSALRQTRLQTARNLTLRDPAGRGIQVILPAGGRNPWLF